MSKKRIPVTVKPSEPVNIPVAPREETVNHPSHYGGDTTYEHVKVAEAWGLVGNAFLYMVTKYICRAGRKNSRLEDLRKAQWYLNREVQRAEAEAEREAARLRSAVESLGGC